ncbi:MAG: hypothetical protein PHH60_02150, partial [Candidatus Margulisbacteria bacterium]|nr:hypothetical protein [Candidatus Margulisiibacteriota bacterium]
MILSYYTKKRITDIVINIIMLAFLAITLLPIFWMVYSSLKDSTDIAIGKVGMRRAATDVLFLKRQDGQLLALSANGGVGLYRSDDLSEIKRQTYKTSVASFLVEANDIWIASANKGLIRVSRENIQNSRRFDLPIWGVDVNKVAATYIKREGNNILVSLEYKSFDGVLVFDTENSKFMKLIKGSKKHYFPNAAVITGKQVAGIDNEVLCQSGEQGIVYLGTRGGWIYKYDTASQKVLLRSKVPDGHLL